MIYVLKIKIFFNFVNNLWKQELTEGGKGLTPSRKFRGGTTPHSSSPLPPPPATNQTRIPNPKPLKHSNKTKLRLNGIKKPLLIYFLFIKTHFSLKKTRFLSNPQISFLCTRKFYKNPTLLPPIKKALQGEVPWYKGGWKIVG